MIVTQEQINTGNHVPAGDYDFLIIVVDHNDVRLPEQIKVKNLTLVSSKSVEDYPDYVNFEFKGRTDLESISIDIDDCIIDPGAFCGCDNLKHVNLHYNIRVVDGAFDGENIYLNKFVDLGLPSGTLWTRIDMDGKPRFEVLPNKNLSPDKGTIPTRNQMKELYSSCLWKNTDEGYICHSQYNGMEILLSKEDYKKICEAYRIQHKYEYTTISVSDPVSLREKLNELGAKGYSVAGVIPHMYYKNLIGGNEVKVDATSIILQREINL